MPKVLNKHHYPGTTPSWAIYVGRPSIWGNPHPIGYCNRCSQKHSREQAISAYKDDILAGIVDITKIRELRGKDLICWCAPKACHADVLLEIVNGKT